MVWVSARVKVLLNSAPVFRYLPFNSTFYTYIATGVLFLVVTVIIPSVLRTATMYLNI